MNGQDYLDQISAENRPVKKSGASFLSSKFFIIGAIGIGLLILIMILGAILGGNKTDEKSLSYALKLHIDNTAEVIQTYQPEVKSSDLRSSSASLSGVLSDTSKKLTDYLTAKYKIKDKDINKKIVEQATLEKDGLTSELFEAKINGILDRTYAYKMAYEIKMIMTEESKIYDKTNNQDLKGILDGSYNSLDNLYSKFNDFSETK